MKIIQYAKKRWYLLLVFVFLIVVGYQKIVVEPAKKEKAETYKVKRRDLKETLSLAGEIAAEEKVTLRFQASGRLVWVGVKEGDYVKKYQTIAALDQRSLKKTLEKYLRDYSKERNDFEEDKQKTYPSGAVTDTIKRILEKNQWDLEKAVLDVELQSITVEYANLWSPIEGIVTRVDAPFAGVNITPAQAEFEIVNPETIYLSLTAEQGDVVYLKNNLKGSITLDAYPENELSGEIYYLAYSPDEEETGTVYRVKVKLDESAGRLQLRLGMTGDGEFIIKQKNHVLAVPEKYIKKGKKGAYVYRQIQGKKVRTAISVGETIDNQVVINSGLNEDDLIVD